MRPFVLALAAALAALLPSTHAYVCEIPTSGCSNGMFNQAKCECECLPPFCPDAHGDCTIASNNCGGNPWTDCERGRDCPWWVNPLNAESCTTGPVVPPGLWNIFNTKTVCCNTNFAYSDVCDAPPVTAQPTKHPTMAAVEDDEYEIVPIKFEVAGLPDEVNRRELKEEMMTVMKRILLRLAGRVPGLKISRVEEKAVMGGKSLLRRLRKLEKTVTLYYNVYVIRSQDKKFGPLIMEELRDSYGEVLEQIQQFTDTQFFGGGNLSMNWCTSKNGKFEDCVQGSSARTPVAAPSRTPPVTFQSDADSGMAGWAVFLLVLFMLVLACCIGYGVWFGCYREVRDDKVKEFENNIYFDSKSRASRRPRDARSKRSKSKSRRQIASTAHYEEYGGYDDRSFATEPKRIGRDPSIYIPGQEDKPDPEGSDILMITDGASRSSRRYYEDPPLKPKREPTMYVDGVMSVEDPSLSSSKKYIAGEPAMEHASMAGEESYGAERMRAEGGEDRYRMEGIDEGEAYGQYDLPPYYSSGHGDGRGDGQSYASFRTEEPSLASKRSKRSELSKRSERSRRSKKGQRKKKEERSSGHREHAGGEWPEEE